MHFGPVYRQYGAQTSVSFQAVNPGHTAVYAAGFIAGTSQISKDGGAFANTTNLPTYIANGMYNIILTATEMQAQFVQLSFIAAASANDPVFITIETKFIVSQIFVGADTLPASNIGFEVRGGGGGGEAVKFWPSAANNNGMTILGNGTGAGLAVTGGATASGLSLSGGATSGSGLYAAAAAGNGHGIHAVGQGTGMGINTVGGATGNGLNCLGGSGSGAGFYAAAAAGNNHGLHAVGFGSGNGITAVAGATGIGLLAQGGATSGEGVKAAGVAGNSNGVTAVASGTGSGLAATGGATNGAGIAGAGQGSGVGFNGSSGSSNPTNFFSEVIEDVTGAPTPGATTLRQALAALVGRFYYKVTQTTSEQKQYKSDSTTVATTSPVSDDGVTQIKGKAV